MLATAGFTAGFRGTMVPAEPIPVVIDNGEGFLPTYGWLAAGPEDPLNVAMGGGPVVIAFEDGYAWHPFRDQVAEPTESCECGNPFARCHPFA